MVSLSKTDDADLGSAGTEGTVSTKYGDGGSTVGANWMVAINHRLTNLGFTATGQYSGLFQGSGWQNGFLPGVFSYGVGGDIVGVYFNKDAAYIPYPSGMKCGAQFFQGQQADPYDPEFSTAALGSAGVGGLAHFVSEYGSRFGHAMAVIPEEADFVSWMDDSGNNTALANSHPDGGLYMLSQSPMMAKSASGHTYANATLYGKTLGLRDFLLNLYACTGSGAPAACCTGVGIGICSADPASGNYIGSSNASTALTALNSAWSMSASPNGNYTTWNTSDGGGLAGIASGTYKSWGGNATCKSSGVPYSCCTGNGTGSCTVGTGLLDENGNNVIISGYNCASGSGNGPSPTDSWQRVAQIKADVHAFMAAFAKAYVSQEWTAWKTACGSSCPPLGFPLYDPPTYVAAVVGPYMDFMWCEMSYYPSVSAAATELQGVINALGNNTPVVVANYMRAQPDSVANGTCPNAGINCLPTQALRGSIYVSYDQAMLGLKNPAGKLAVVGLEHWSLYDSKTQNNGGTGAGTNFGLFTVLDNGYDGSSASTLGTPSNACATNTVYSMPAFCKDTNGNFQALSISSGSCTSGSVAPTWPPTTSNVNISKYGVLTPDGTCNWFNDGVFTRAAGLVETGSWGNALLAIAQFQTGNLCDPVGGLLPPTSLTAVAVTVAR